MRFRTSQPFYSNKAHQIILIPGGGIPIGSILLIEEDKFVRYSEFLAKYFLAEGVVHKHSLFLAQLDGDPKEMVCVLN